MKAVVLHEYGGPEKLKLEDGVPDPQISGDTVLVAAAAASVNPIDWKVRSGARQKDFPLSFPAILGRDVSGIVRAVGANVKHFKPGDRVLALSNHTYAELVAVADSGSNPLAGWFRSGGRSSDSPDFIDRRAVGEACGEGAEGTDGGGYGLWVAWGELRCTLRRRWVRG